MSVIRLAINGYGRIGRCIHRQLLAHPKIKVIAINSRSDASMHAHLLQYDSIYGPCEVREEGRFHAADIQAPDEKTLLVEGEAIQVFQNDPPDLPWGDLDIDVVVEATGRLITADGAELHLKAGAKKVLITAPCGSLGIPTIVMGVNHNTYDPKERIVSNASCTTNCLAPLLDILDTRFGIREGFFTTAHAATGSQNILDNSGKDFRRARSFLPSLIPTKTGAMKAVAKVLPHLVGKLEGLSLRVPTAIVSCLDLMVNVQKKTSAEEVNAVFQKAAQENYLNIVAACGKPLVSIDFKGDPHSAIVDLLSTKVLNGTCLKILAWYDNEWGYSARVVDLVEVISRE
jgi:glyceraldehyde 3-phosphate dehydrogenase